MHMKLILQLLLLFAVVCFEQFEGAFGARILAAFVFPGKSHFVMTNALIRELINRGHEVTFITPFSLAKEQLGSNYTEIVLPKYDLWSNSKKKYKFDTVLEMGDLSMLDFLDIVHEMGPVSCDYAFAEPTVQALINEPNKAGKFDLLLAEQFFNEPMLILAHLYNIPIVTMTTFGFAHHMSSITGIVNPWSYVPHNYLPLTSSMSFTERVYNVYVSGAEELKRKFSYIPTQNAILHKHFSHLLKDEVPTVSDLERRVSAILLNNYMPLATPRPLSFNMILVGGLHIQPPKALPKNLQKFLDDAKDGAIYFSLGTQVRSAELPPEKLKIFLDVFASLKQRVLWKFEDEHIPNLPKNVMVQKWMPQNDVLAHQNVKVFISHGGLFGSQEAVHYGVPVLGMPVYCDQYHNIKLGIASGYALILELREMTAESLKHALLDLIENPKYRENMGRASRIFNDRPAPAMDTAMYWINYVIKHNGAPHLRVDAGLKLSWYQFYLLDIFVFPFIIILVLWCLLRRGKSVQQKLKVK